jgi:hypothetical protein
MSVKKREWWEGRGVGQELLINFWLVLTKEV